MKSERWQQIKPVLEAALEREVSARQAYLNQACLGDEPLRLEVEAYLQAHDCADDFLDAPALELLARDMAEQAAPLANNQTPRAVTRIAAAKPTSISQEPDFSPGALLEGRYLIERELGVGGFSVVFLAHDQKLHGKEVAIKVLSERLTASEHKEWLEKKFRDEIKALSLINHPGAVHLHDIGQLTDGRSYLVMDYVPGCSLRAAMSSAVMPLSRVGKLIDQIAQSLTTVHEQNIIHRDLKPENLMLQTTSGKEYAMLIDFGIASVRDELERTGYQATKVAGTIYYMAPEQLRGNPAPASDIFSLGVIAYEMITCQRPFNADNGFTLLEQQRAGVRVKPCELRPELPVAAQEAILRALAFEPADRYARACDFGVALSRALSLEVKEAPPPDLELAHVLFTDLVGYS
ncbi:MAG: serine/threonine-protein kinase, partial [Blastocatellia bacterium]